MPSHRGGDAGRRAAGGAGRLDVGARSGDLRQGRRRWPIEAKESMRWLEGFKRGAELAASLPDTRLVYVADRECDIRELMVRARRPPQVVDRPGF